MWDWVWDEWERSLPKTVPADWAGPPGEEFSHRVYRGGSWRDGPEVARVSLRVRYDPGARWNDLGLRLTRSE